MEIKELLKAVLHLPEEWEIGKVIILEQKKEINIKVNYTSKEGVCKKTGEICPIYDYRSKRSWRHLDFMGYHTYLISRIPRIKNSLGEVRSVPIPWADEDNRGSRDFENHTIEVLKATRNQTKAGELLGISYDKVHNVMKRSVARGLERRDLSDDEIPHIHIDEKSYRKGHKYATIISDSLRNRVIDVGEDRTQEATEELIESAFSSEQLQSIKAVCVDMWDPFINAVKKNFLMPKLCMINFML
jgi:transposase